MEPDVFPTLSLTARAVTYYQLALGMCIVLALYWPSGHAASVLAMATPALSVLALQLVVTRDGWRRGGWTSLGLGRLGSRRVWAVATGLPLAVVAISEAAVRLTGLTSWHLPTGAESVVWAAALPIGCALAFFEEIGWRGYLSPLMDQRGGRAAQLQVGLLHGIWHLPLVFLATDGYLTEGNRWVIVPIFLGVLTASGPLYGWLRRTSGSVWPAVVTHGVFNWALLLASTLAVTSHPDTVAALGREAGIVTLVALAGATLWFTTRSDSTTSSETGAEAVPAAA
jgi:membrane protease YdiL (CAAX protease family)